MSLHTDVAHGGGLVGEEPPRTARTRYGDHDSLAHAARHLFFFLMIGAPPRSPLFPYPPLFRSSAARWASALASECARRSRLRAWFVRSEEHTSELQSRVDISYAVFCLKKKR